MAPLPPPINGTEAYLAAVLDRLGEMLNRMPERRPEAPAATSETVELREPQAQSRTPASVEAPTEVLTEPTLTPTRTTRKRTTTKKGS